MRANFSRETAAFNEPIDKSLKNHSGLGRGERFDDLSLLLSIGGRG